MKLECALGVMAAVLAVAMAAKKCPVCDPEACPALNGANCLAGTTKDDCGCCDICARLEGRPCNIDANDQCGDGLECRESESTGAICLCKFQEILCGSDNKTYSNLCQLMATAVREQRTNTLNVKSVGPCEPGATIVTKPEYVRNHTDSNVVLQCEAMGLPTPSMAWVFTRADNQTFNLPVTSAHQGDHNTVCQDHVNQTDRQLPKPRPLKDIGGPTMHNHNCPLVDAFTKLTVTRQEFRRMAVIYINRKESNHSFLKLFHVQASDISVVIGFFCL